MDRAERGLLQEGYACAVLLDSQGAFDRATFISMEKALRGAGCPEDQLVFLMACLANRKITPIQCGENRAPAIRPTRGTPQGGILSPNLWGLVADLSTLSMEEKFDVTIVRYADDEAIIATGSDLNEIIPRLQKVVDHLVDYNEGMGLRYSADKTQAIVFTAKQAPNFLLSTAPQVSVKKRLFHTPKRLSTLG